MTYNSQNHKIKNLENFRLIKNTSNDAQEQLQLSIIDVLLSI